MFCNVHVLNILVTSLGYVHRWRLAECLSIKFCSLREWWSPVSAENSTASSAEEHVQTSIYLDSCLRMRRKGKRKSTSWHGWRRSLQVRFQSYSTFALPDRAAFVVKWVRRSDGARVHLFVCIQLGLVISKTYLREGKILCSYLPLLFRRLLLLERSYSSTGLRVGQKRRVVVVNSAKVKFLPETAPAPSEDDHENDNTWPRNVASSCKEMLIGLAYFGVTSDGLVKVPVRLFVRYHSVPRHGSNIAISRPTFKLFAFPCLKVLFFFKHRPCTSVSNVGSGQSRRLVHETFAK